LKQELYDAAISILHYPTLAILELGSRERGTFLMGEFEKSGGLVLSTHEFELRAVWSFVATFDRSVADSVDIIDP
jgi:hypothetical protein